MINTVIIKTDAFFSSTRYDYGHRFLWIFGSVPIIHIISGKIKISLGLIQVISGIVLTALTYYDDQYSKARKLTQKHITQGIQYIGYGFVSMNSWKLSALALLAICGDNFLKKKKQGEEDYAELQPGAT